MVRMACEVACLLGLAAAAAGRASAADMPPPTSWAKLELKSEDPAARTSNDVSFLLDAPAGNHGFVEAVGNGFAFEDGTPVRFSGVVLNFTSRCGGRLIPKERLDRVAYRLAKAGMNIARFHGMVYLARPQSWESGNTPEDWDRFDYLFARLKERGIYSLFLIPVICVSGGPDWFGDQEAAGLSGTGLEQYYDRRLIDVNKEYLTRILTHRNPYTNTTYAEEPALALIELVDEKTFFDHSQGAQFAQKVGGRYLDEFENLWNAWLKAKYPTRSELAQAWEDLQASEDPAAGTARRAGQEELYNGTRRSADTARFLYELEGRFYAELRDHVRSLGARAPVCGDCYGLCHPAHLKANAALDWVNIHRYWIASPGWRGYNQSMSMVQTPWRGTDTDGADSTPSDLNKTRMSGKPFGISEWGVAWGTEDSNAYAIEAIPLMAAYGSYSGWDLMTQHDWGAAWSDIYDDWTDEMVVRSSSAIGNKPTMVWLHHLANLIFQRQDVRPAPQMVKLHLTDSQVFDPKGIDILRYNSWGEIRANPPYLPLVAPFEIVFADEPQPVQLSGYARYHDEERATVTALTGEIRWHYGEGTVEIDTPRTQGVIGLVGGRRFSLSGVQLDVANPYCVIAVSSLSDRPIEESDRMLVFTIGRATAGENGRGILLEPIRAELRIRHRSHEKLVGYALDMAGFRTSSLDLQVSDDGVILRTLSDRAVLGYELVVAGGDGR